MVVAVYETVNSKNIWAPEALNCH